MSPAPTLGVVTRQTDRGNSFVSDRPLRPRTLGGRPAVSVFVRLTSYRALPLSCVESMDLTIDGVRHPSETLVLFLNGTPHPLGEMGDRRDVWWFVLDHGELVVPLDAPLAPGEHDVEGTLVTVEPYVSNGRFHFTSTSSRRLPLERGPGADR